MRTSTIVILIIVALTLIGLRGRFDEVRAALPNGGTEMSAIAVRDGTVQQILDGDTIKLTDGRTVRLLQVDAPQIGNHGECFGAQAKAWLAKQLPAGTELRMKRDPDLPERDADGKLLRYVYRASDILFINQRLAQTGAGAPYFADGKRGVHADDFERLARVARKAPVGLWRVCAGTRYAPERNVDTGPAAPKIEARK